MKTLVYLTFISILIIMSLTSSKKPYQNKNSVLVNQESFVDNGGYFDPQKYYTKQCTFCHNDSGKIGPPMSEIKMVYLKAYPGKKEFIKKMTAFVIDPNDENRLIKNNKGKYKVMPSDMFYDTKKIQKVSEYIYNVIKVPKKKKIIPKTTSNKVLYLNKNNIHHINNNKPKNPVNINIEIPRGTNLYEIMKMPPVDFNYAKYTLKDTMKKQLDKIVVFLKANPSIKIEIRNHTDSRGSSRHNMDLSNKRANSIRNYIINKGIHPGRIKAKGFGETQLLNYCKDGVKCTNEQHKQNRRTEIIIL